VRPIGICLSLLLLSVACENSTDPLIGFGGTGGGTITQAEAAGSWSFTVRKTATLPCSGGALPDGQIITAQLNVAADGTVSATTSSWQNPPTALVRPISGLVRLSDGFTDLFLSASSGSTSAMELRGTITATSTFTGTMTDPAPGSAAVFSAGGCEYTTTGTKA
jgi:hypothetical protein